MKREAKIKAEGDLAGGGTWRTGPPGRGGAAHFVVGVSDAPDTAAHADLFVQPSGRLWLTLYVDEALRGRGLGERLLEHAAAFAEKYGASRVYFEADNQSFWEHVAEKHKSVSFRPGRRHGHLVQMGTFDVRLRSGR